jgi:hypothetical protein
MVVRDIWISGSGFNGSYGKALIENHDKLTLLRLVGVPTPVAGHDSRWIDNGPGTGQPEGLLVVRDCRFGGEAGGMTIIVNRMSYLCMHQPANCSACRPTCLPPPGRGPLPTGREITYASVSGSIVVDNCAIASTSTTTGAQGIPGGTAIYLEQIPSQLVVKNSNGFTYGPGPSSSHQMVRVSPDIDLDDSGQIEYLSGGACDGDGFGQPNCVRFDIADNNVIVPGNYSVRPLNFLRLPSAIILLHDIMPSAAVHDCKCLTAACVNILQSLPEQLQPFLIGRREAQGPPSRGTWRAGHVVWAAVGSAAARNGTAGWRCSVGGKPGEWKAFVL